MSIAEQIRSNAEVHGIRWTVRWAIQKRLNMDTVHYVLTGKYRGQKREG